MKNLKANPFLKKYQNIKFEKDGYKIEQEIAKDYLDWTPETILERGMKILEFMEQRWNIKIGSPDNKRKLLFLDGKIK